RKRLTFSGSSAPFSFFRTFSSETNSVGSCVCLYLMNSASAGAKRSGPIMMKPLALVAACTVAHAEIAKPSNRRISIFCENRPISAEAEFARGLGRFGKHQPRFTGYRDELESLFATSRSGLPIRDMNAWRDVVLTRGFQNVIDSAGELFVVGFKNWGQA